MDGAKEGSGTSEDQNEEAQEKRDEKDGETNENPNPGDPVHNDDELPSNRSRPARHHMNNSQTPQTSETKTPQHRNSVPEILISSVDLHRIVSILLERLNQRRRYRQFIENRRSWLNRRSQRRVTQTLTSLRIRHVPLRKLSLRRSGSLEPVQNGSNESLRARLKRRLAAGQPTKELPRHFKQRKNAEEKKTTNDRQKLQGKSLRSKMQRLLQLLVPRNGSSGWLRSSERPFGYEYYTVAHNKLRIRRCEVNQRVKKKVKKKRKSK